jgi:predicted transcriptional regulator
LNLARVEGSLFAEVLGKMRNGHLRLRCLVPREAQPQGGLTIYGSTCGRYPVPPTLIVE